MGLELIMLVIQMKDEEILKKWLGYETLEKDQVQIYEDVLLLMYKARADTAREIFEELKEADKYMTAPMAEILDRIKQKYLKSEGEKG